MPRKSKRHPRHTTHKPRSVWFAQRACWPYRDASPAQLEERMWLHPEAPPHWDCVGPFNVAGRVTALAIHPKRNVLFAGTAAGGLWRSNDFGRTWTEPSRRLYLPPEQRELGFGGFVAWPNNNIGALAIDPSDPDHIYGATGEANLSADCYPGAGIFHSTDGGITWFPFAACRDVSLPRRIGAIAVDPFDSSHIRLGGVTHSETDAAGMFYSTDGGRTWAVERIANRNYHCHDVVFHPSSPGILFAAVDARGMRSGIWRSLDGGASWQNLCGEERGRGLPEGCWFGRTSLAISQSRPDVIFAFAANRRGGVLGLFRSDDCGDSWRNVATRALRYELQMFYTNTVAVHPLNPEFVAVGGLDIHISEDGGRRWRRSSHWDADFGQPHHAHADHHALLILPNGHIIDGNDGGVAVSEDHGRTWHARIDGMCTTMFYDVDVAPTNVECFGGGSQDNGTLLHHAGDPVGSFRREIPGDGAWTVYDPADEENVFSSWQDVHIKRRLRKGGGGWLRASDGEWKEVSPRGISAAERKERAIAVMVIDPVRRPGKKAVWVGTHRLWKTVDAGRTWAPQSEGFDGSPITAIEIADQNSKLMFVGTTNGGIFRSVDGGNSWSANIAGSDLPARLISRIDSHMRPDTNLHRLIVTVAGTGVGKSLVDRDPHGALVDRGYSHVFVSHDDGLSWIDADLGMLPDLPYQAAVWETNPPYRAFVGGDAGVFALEEKNGELEWTNITGNLPNVIVSDLVYHDATGILTAATYGRGIWRLKV